MSSLKSVRCGNAPGTHDVRPSQQGRKKRRSPWFLWSKVSLLCRPGTHLANPDSSVISLPHRCRASLSWTRTNCASSHTRMPPLWGRARLPGYSDLRCDSGLLCLSCSQRCCAVLRRAFYLLNDAFPSALTRVRSDSGFAKCRPRNNKDVIALSGGLRAAETHVDCAKSL